MKKNNSIDIAALLRSREFNAEQPPPPEEIIFRIEFQTIACLGDYILLTGLPKAGKTKYLSGAMAAAVSRREVFGMNIKLPDHKRRVAHFDTEQGKRSHHNVLTLTKLLMEESVMPTHFNSYHCRQDSPANIIAMIEHYLTLYPDTGLLFLDGLLDCIESFNDEKASKWLVNWLKRITEEHNCSLVGILHRSLSVNKSIGHLGSSADRAAQSVLVVEKNKETRQYILKAEYLRDADDFTPIAIWYNKQLQLWERTDYMDNANGGPVKQIKRRPSEYDISEHAEQVRRIFNSAELQSYADLIQRIIEVYPGVGMKWAKECVAELERNQLIFRTETGFTNIRQRKLSMLVGA
jgi:hypothetical protein